MLISTGKLTRDSLATQVVVVTGAGGGIGYEAARSLLWLVQRHVNRRVRHAARSLAAA